MRRPRFIGCTGYAAGRSKLIQPARRRSRAAAGG
jgi:hypothetical protein